jgi:polysaccharide deacetylase 2 family uncharacterized protein YibQ
VDENSGLSIGNDSAPTLGKPEAQVAVATPERSDTPAVSSEAPTVPQVTDDLNAAAVQEEAAPTPTGETAPALVAGNAIKDNAVPVQGSDERPYFSIILEDVGSDGVPREGLTALSAAMSFGVPVNDPDAPAIASLYGDAGFEVVALLPESGPQLLTASMSANDVTSNLAAYLAAVPNATAVLDRRNSELTGSVTLAETVLDGLNVTGHGLLTYPRNGLTAVQDQIAAAGVPGAQIFRVIDEPADPESIKLALDQAVAEAKSTGGVVVVGHTRSETITTLVSWLLGASSSGVRIVPASAAIERLSK